MSEEVISCPICSEPATELFPGVYKCTKCRHVTDQSMVVDAMGYCEEKKKGTCDYKEVIESDIARMNSRWEFVLRHTKGKKTLLDYGCADNHFIKCAPEGHGFEELVGFDTNWMTGFQDERKLDRHYDVLTMWHSLEHIRIPRMVVDRVSHEYLILAIPWAEFLTNENIARLNIFNAGRHVHLYTRESFFNTFNDYELLEENYDDGHLAGYNDEIVSFALRKK